jgi:heat shock protein HspQ
MINLNDGYSVTPKTPKFSPGEVVCHLRYEYRGLIVELDNTCQAAEDWYLSNQSQPDRDQPWYHILVDGGQHISYVAESNLELDPTKSSVVHPLLNLFFFGVDEGNNRYLRNDVPFDPGEPPDALPPPPPPEDIPPPLPPELN